MCEADRGDMRSTRNYTMLPHGVVRRKPIARAHFPETRERCSGMRGGAQNLSVGLKKSLVFTHPEYDLPDSHFCEGARPATSDSSVGKHFYAPQTNGENGACSCARFAWSKKELLSHQVLDTRKRRPSAPYSLWSLFTRGFQLRLLPLLLWPHAWPPDRVLEMLANIRPRHTCGKSSQRNSWFLSTVPHCPISAALFGTPAGAAILENWQCAK